MSQNSATPLAKRYVLGKQLGKGGMGAVYEATDRLNGDRIALKRVLVNPSGLSLTNAGESSDLRMALAQEFRLMASLRHPNINSVLDYGFDDTRQPFFTMELLVDVQSLYHAVQGKTDAVKVAFLVQILQALSYLHRVGILHRDLKPGNILVVKDMVKVLDFGISLSRDQLMAEAEAEFLSGTLGYIAPEVIMGNIPDQRSDLYAVGIIAYELFTGARPFDESAPTQVLIHETVMKIPDGERIKDPRIRYVIMRLLTKDPEDRFRNAEETIEAFCEAIHQTPPDEDEAIRESFLQAARFVGRAWELQELTKLLKTSIDGKGNICLVGGESGVGKTRLMDELRTQALVEGAIVLRGQNTKESGAPYQMWRSALRWLVAVDEIDLNDASVIKSLVPDIETLIKRPVPDAPEVSAFFAKARLLTVIEKLFRNHKTPILLILEDLHWASSESLSVLHRFHSVIQSLPLFIVGSYRSDEMPTLPDSIPPVPILKLSRLTHAAIEELSAAILGEERITPKLVEYLQRETEGNVFFLVEVMRALAESAGKLGNISDNLPEHIFSGGMAQIIQRRLNSVPSAYRDLLKIAAVAGRFIDKKIMRQFVSPELLERGLLVCTNTAVLEVHEGGWRFAHDKMRDGVLADIPEAERKTLHRKVAEALEAVYMLSTAYTTEIAYHWHMAGDAEKEAQAAALAGKQALTTGAYGEAVKFLKQAFALTPPDTANDKKRGGMLQQLANAYLGLDNYEQANAIGNQCLDIYRQANYRWGIASIHNDLGMIDYYQNKNADAYDHFYEALRVATDNRAAALALDALVGVGGVTMRKGIHNRAAELLYFALNNPASTGVTIARAKELISELEKVAFSDTISEGKKRAEATKLSEIAKTVLDMPTLN